MRWRRVPLELAGRRNYRSPGPVDGNRSAVSPPEVVPFLRPHRGRLNLGRPFKAGLNSQPRSAALDKNRSGVPVESRLIGRGISARQFELHSTPAY